MAIDPGYSTEQHLQIDAPSATPGDLFIWAVGQMSDFWYRAANDGAAHEDSLSFFVGPRLTNFYGALPMVAITEVRFSPEASGTATVSLPFLALSSQADVMLTGSASVDPTTGQGVAWVSGNVGVSGGVGFGEDITVTFLADNIGWYIQSAVVDFDAVEKRARLTVVLGVIGEVILNRLSYHVTIHGNITPVEVAPGGDLQLPPGRGWAPKKGGH